MLDDLRKYGTALSAGTAGSDLVRLSIRKSGSDSFATGSDWSPTAGDVKVSKDGGAQANIGTLPSYSNGSWEFTLSGTELTAKMVRVIVANASIINDDFTLKTFGNASAMYPADYEDVTRMGMTQIPATGTLPTVGTGANQIAVDGSGNVSANFSATGQQQISQITGRETKTYFVRTDGSGADGLSLATAYTSIATAATAAAGVAGAGVSVGPGTFTETSLTTLAQYGRLVGSGADRTTLADATQTNGVLVEVASNTLVSGIRVVGTAAAANYQYAIGDRAVGVTNVVVMDGHFGTDSDGAYFQNSGSSARFYRCFFDSHWDCMAMQAGTGILVECFGCYFRTTGPNTEFATASSTLNIAAGNTLRVYDSHVVNAATNVNASRATNVVLAAGSTTPGGGARIELYNTTIETNISSTEKVRQIYVGLNATVVLQNCTYDPSKVAMELSVPGSPTGGTFALTVTNGLGSQTATINFNDTAATVQSDLQALSNVGAGNVTATGGFLPGGVIILTFAASLGPVTLSANNSGLTGGSSPAAAFGTVIVQNTPINEPGQIAPGALAASAIVPGTIAQGSYTGVKIDLVDAPNATAVAAIQNGLATTTVQMAVKAKTDLIATNAADSPNQQTTQTTIGTNLNATISSRLAASSYVAPDNADVVTALSDLVSLLGRADPTTAIAAIKAVTDQLSPMISAGAFTAPALINAPSGGSGGGTTNVNVSSTEVRTQ